MTDPDELQLDTYNRLSERFLEAYGSYPWWDLPKWMSIRIAEMSAMVDSVGY